MSDTDDKPQADANVETAEEEVKEVEQEKEQSVASVEDGAGNVEDKEEIGLMGEIMDLVRNGSPAEDKKVPDHEEDEPNIKVVDESNDRDDKERESIDTEGGANGLGSENKTEETIVEANPKTEENAKEAVAEGEEETVQNKAATEEKHFITPHLLTDEEIIAKGVAESDIEMYRKFHLKVSYGPKAWYDKIKNHTVTTEFIVLSPEEINALLSIYHLPNDDVPEVSEEVQAVIEELTKKIDSAVSKYDDGAFIKVNTHSPKDAILDRYDADHIQDVEDGIRNELEIEQQFVNAYLNWRSWRSMSYRENSRTKLPSENGRSNVVRRSFRRIQKSFNRPRAQTSVERSAKEEDKDKDDKPLAEEEDGIKKEDSKIEKDDQEPIVKDASEGAEDKGTEQEKEEEITVKATVEKTVDTNEHVAAEVDKEVKEEDVIQVADEPEKPKEECSKEESKSADEEIETATTEKKSDKKEDEIEELKPTVESNAEEREQREARIPPPMLGKETHFIKVKSETRGNKVLRAFIKATTALYKVSSGEQAIKLLSTSQIIKEDLEQAKVFANITGTEATLSIQRWHDDIAKYPGMQFRGFVCKGKLNALSPKDDVTYIPNIVRYKTTIQTKIVQFFNTTVKPSFVDLDNYIVDIFVGVNKIYVLDLYPFYPGTGACLFTWQQNKDVFIDGPLQFRHIPTPFKNCFTGLPAHWQQVCNNALQKKIREEPRSGKCVIL